MVLPAGFSLPPLPYAAVLLVATALVGWRLHEARPSVDDRTVLAFAPWMVAGAAGYACYQLGIVPDPLAPLASSPTVYVTTFVVAGTVWLVARRVRERPPIHLALGGTIVACIPVGAALGGALARGTLTLAWPFGGALAALVLGGGVWLALRRIRPETAVTGYTGLLVLVGHALDGVSTAVGVDVLGYGEQTPLSRLVIEFGHSLPTDPYLGGAWVFVLLKLALASFLVVAFADYVEAEPAEGRLLLALVAALGVGPGAHNVVLFAAGA